MVTRCPGAAWAVVLQLLSTTSGGPAGTAGAADALLAPNTDTPVAQSVSSPETASIRVVRGCVMCSATAYVYTITVAQSTIARIPLLRNAPSLHSQGPQVSSPGGPVSAAKAHCVTAVFEQLWIAPL